MRVLVVSSTALPACDWPLPVEASPNAHILISVAGALLVGVILGCLVTSIVLALVDRYIWRRAYRRASDEQARAQRARSSDGPDPHPGRERGF